MREPSDAEETTFELDFPSLLEGSGKEIVDNAPAAPPIEDFDHFD